MRILLFFVLINLSSNVVAQLNCNNWLNIPNFPGKISIGDLDITGNKITVEANFNAKYTYSTLGYSSNVVSKHSGAADCNYSLRVHAGEITTTNGYFSAGTNCNYEINKTYHVALVYDGNSLVFYRNGFKLSETLATGNLVTNNLIAIIGDYANATANESLPGYINEVRIWNVARSQSQIRQYMNTTLPTPTTQTGLLGYYVFDNLQNKQGNAAFNGTINGSAIVNQTNPNCTFGADSCGVMVNNGPCNNWLNTPTFGSTLSIGDLDVSGNQITVEANFNSKGTSTNGSWGHLVSKHTGANNINYAISPNGVEIGTSNGYFFAVQNCSFVLNKMYHIALVYNGNSLRFYRNGYLIKETFCSGNLIQNDLLTTIANVSGSPASSEQFNGFTNEVRIWNVARSQDQIRQYMNTTLPTPTTQTGLLGYYVFDNLQNKQGNTAFNGTINGNATINQTNPNCNYVADSCETIISPNCTNWLNGSVMSIKDSVLCSGEVLFNGIATPLNNTITNWSWSFGDGANATSQNTNHSYAVAGNYNVKMIVTNANGCKDSVNKIVTVNTFLTSVTPNTTICHNTPITLSATGGASYLWLPSATLSSNNIANPIATPITTTKYYVNITNALGCTKLDSVTVTVTQKPTSGFSVSKTTICQNDTLQFNAFGGTSYLWSPSIGLNNNNIANPIAQPSGNTNYTVQVISNICNDTTIYTSAIVVNPLPIITVTKSNDINCVISNANLQASGGVSYVWSPAIGLSNNTIPNPIVVIDTTTKYSVKTITLNGCVDSITITINVTKTGTALFLVPNVFTPNNDGINDCFSISHWGGVTLSYFAIYNRWGQKVFYSNNPNQCWDGTFKNKIQSGTYVYQIKGKSFCGDVYKKGTIVLVK